MTAIDRITWHAEKAARRGFTTTRVRQITARNKLRRVTGKGI